MKAFEYTTWSGRTKRVEADRVEFSGVWVTFWTGDRLVLATKENDVNNLYEVEQ